MSGLRTLVVGGGGAVEGGGVLLGPLLGAGLSSAAGVTERRYGNAVVERLANTSNISCFAWELGVFGWCFERPWFTLCPGPSRPRHGGGRPGPAPL